MEEKDKILRELERIDGNKFWMEQVIEFVVLHMPLKVSVGNVICC